ncbi:MAG: AsmA family protein [Acidobacteriota bacterium]|nr:AsmA family protein [Acidobacteriota bacterium]
MKRMTMTQDAQRRLHKSKRLWLTLAALAVVLAVLIVPPLVSISSYKNRITQLVSVSLGRPVRLSSVELRLLPRPGFVLTDLTVEEDPAFGAEPVLRANTVTASIRLLSLWRGRLEISRIGVDEASLNLVRTKEGRWNLYPLFHTATGQAHGALPGRALALPYLEATNSRINIKSGLEKLPFSLMNADLSFWQENPGDWRVRLRGQPARTDVSLDMADTGILELEASLQRAPSLRQMPVHLNLEWREAQLGQLSRLIVGSDPGWRGDLTAELHLDGTAETAQVKTRLRASGVHRAEFAPAVPLDFDANCGFVYHYSGRSVEGLACDSPLGNGHIRLAGSLPGNAPPQLSVELQTIPVQAGLDVLRTLRSGLGEGLEARGTVSGKLAYVPSAAAAKPASPALKRHARKQTAMTPAAAQPALSGSLAVEGFSLSGDGLSQPIQIAKTVLEPAPATEGQGQALTAAVAIPAGGSTPLAIAVRLALSGYQVTLRGPASLARIREMAHVAGIEDISALESFTGDPATLNLSAEGPWLPTPEMSLGGMKTAASATGQGVLPSVTTSASDQLSGTVTLRNAIWKSDYLASDVEIAQATLHLGADTLRWDPVVFSYGPVKGTASLAVPAPCEAPETCPPRLDLQFGELDASALQAAFLGARKPGTLLSTLIARLRPSSAPLWPRLESTVKVDSLLLGPVKLQNAEAALRLLPAGAEISSFDAGLLGGRVHVTGDLASGDMPAYTLQGNFSKLNSSALCLLVGLRCTGGAVDGSGKVDLSGYADKDLAASARGSLHFDWRHGAVRGPAAIPAALARFDRWTADAEITHGVVTLKQSQVELGARKTPVEATVTFGDPPKTAFGAPKAAPAAKP